MLKKMLIFIILLLSIFIISFSAASAVELNETAVENQNIDDINENTDILSLDNNYEEYGDASNELTTDKAKYTFSQTGYYYGETKLHVSITNLTNNKGIEGKKVGIYVDEKLWNEYKTNSKGQFDVDFKKDPGNYNLKAKLHDETKLTLGSLDITILAIPTNFELIQTGAYYKDAALRFKLTNIMTKKPVSNANINVKFSNGKTEKLTTNSNGEATYNVAFEPGTYSVTGTTSSKYLSKNQVNLKFTIGKTYLKIDAKDLSTTYNSAKTLNVKVTNYFTGNVMKNTKINLKVCTGSKFKTVTLTTNSNGNAKYDTSGLGVGTHKIVIKNGEKYCDGAEKTVNVKVTKAKLIISAPKITAAANSNKNFRITVKNKETNNAMKNVKVIVKVYTGKKYKNYNVKTNSKGKASISTEGLKKSTHNVVISVKANSNINAATSKSTITII